MYEQFLEEISDDYYGLWEVKWMLEERFPDLDTSGKIAVLLSFVKTGKVAVYFGKMGSSRTPVDVGLATDLISKESSWGDRTSLDQEVVYLISDHGV